MKYVITATEYEYEDTHELYTNLKKPVIDANLNYGKFNKWKSKNNIDLPIEYKGFLFEKVEVKWLSETYKLKLWN